MLRRTVNMSVRPNNVPFNVVGGVDSGYQRCQKSRNRRESLTYGITNEIQLLTGYCGQMRPRTFINPNPIRNAWQIVMPGVPYGSFRMVMLMCDNGNSSY